MYGPLIYDKDAPAVCRGKDGLFSKMDVYVRGC